MLVDDPVKRVDNMTMAWGLEAPGARSSTTTSSSWPRPARRSSRLADGGKGVLKDVGAPGHPARGHRPAQGLLPGARAHPPRGQVARPGARRAATRPAPRSGACSGRSTVDALLADPNGELTPLRGNKLWQLGLLELWLQTHGV